MKEEGAETNKHTHAHTYSNTQHTSNGLRECCIPHLIGSKKIQHRAPSKVNFSQQRASQSHGVARSPGPHPPGIGTDNLLLEPKQWSHTLTQMTLCTKTHSEKVFLSETSCKHVFWIWASSRYSKCFHSYLIPEFVHATRDGGTNGSE